MQQRKAKQNKAGIGKRLFALLLTLCMLTTGWNASAVAAFAEEAAPAASSAAEPASSSAAEPASSSAPEPASSSIVEVTSSSIVEAASSSAAEVTSSSAAEAASSSSSAPELLPNVMLSSVPAPIDDAATGSALDDGQMDVTLSKVSASSDNYVTLTQEGIDVEDWSYNKDIRYLNITVPGQNEQFTIDIDLDVSMAVCSSTNPNPLPADNLISVTSTENDYSTVTKDPDNTELQAELKKDLAALNSGSGSRSVDLKYTIKVSEYSTTISVPIIYNPILWDKQANSSINVSEPAVKVTMTRDNSTLTKKINKVKAAEYYGGGNDKPLSLYLFSDNRYFFPNDDGKISPVMIDSANLLAPNQANDVKVFWKEATLTITPKVYKDDTLQDEIFGEVPIYYTDTSQTETTSVGGYKYPHAKNISTVDSTGVTTYEFEDWYGDIRSFFAQPTYRFDGKNYENNNVIVFEYCLVVKSYTENTIPYNNTTDCKFTYRTVTTLYTAALDNFDTTKNVNWSAWAPHNDDGIIDYLGGFRIQNRGPTTAPLKIEMDFDINNTGLQRVSAVRLPVQALTNHQLEVECEIINKDTQETEDVPVTLTVSTGSNATGRLLSILDLPAQYKNNGWYFKSVTYKLPKIPAGATLFNSQAVRNKGTGGSIWGTIESDDDSNNKVTKQITITALDAEGNPLTSTEDTQTWTATHIVAATKANMKSAAYIDKTIYLKGPSESDPTTVSIDVVAGNKATITALLTHTDYPYTASGRVYEPILYFLAPSGVSLVDAKVKSGGNSFGTWETSTLSDGKTVYKIPLKNPYGGWEVSGSSINSISGVNVELTISTQADMSATNISISNSLYVSDGKLPCGLGGSASPDAHTDTYNLLSNGVNSKIGGTRSESHIGIVAAKNILLTTTDAKLNTEPETAYHSNESEPVVINSNAHSVDYRLRIQNQSATSVAAADFYYYIPIPKEGKTFAGLLDAAPQYSLALTGAADVTGFNLQIYDVRYAVGATDANYDNNAANFDDNNQKFVKYYTADEINSAQADVTSGISWADVNMVKIVAQSAIPSNANDCVRLRMGLQESSDENFIANHVGQTISWQGKGIQKGQDSSNEKLITNKIAVQLKYVGAQSVELTAQYVTDDIERIGTKLADITLPELVPFQTLKISNVAANNVTLVDDITETEDARWPSTTANSTFAIKAANTETGDTLYSLQEGKNTDCTLTWQAGTNPLHLQLSNAKNLTDPVTPRTVSITLTNADDTVEYVVTVNIKVVKTTIDDPPIVSAAVGKHYDLLGDNWADTSYLEIVNNSVFTAQFGVTEPPDPGDTSLNSSYIRWNTGAFPVGTAVTMVFRERLTNSTISTSSSFYYYKVEGEKNSILVSDFISMADGTSAADITAKSGVFLFVVDFSGTSGIATGNVNTLNFKSAYGSNAKVDVRVSQAAGYSVELTIPISSPAVTATMVDTADLTVNISEHTGYTDAANQHQRLGLVISLEQDGTKKAFPEGSVINYAGSPYTLSDGKFVIPAGSGKSEASYTLQLRTPYERIAPGDYNIKAELWLSATANGSKPMGGKSVATASQAITVQKKASYALDVTGTTRLLKEADTEQLAVHIHYNEAARHDSGYGTLVTFSVQKKDGLSYVTDTSALTSVTTGGKTLPATNGIIHATGFFDGSNNKQEDVTITLNTNIAPGSYRALFRLSGNNIEAIEVPFNFIVLDE